MESVAHDLVISPTEINDHQGTGILLQRLFPDSRTLVTLRSLSVYGGQEEFGVGHHELKSATLTVAETEARLREILARYRIGRILCVPYFREDFVHGCLARALTGAPLCTYVMDDQNIFTPKVRDHWVQDLLDASDLCLGISPELCAAYEHKFARPFHLLPPLLDRPELLVPCYWPPGEGPRKVAMIGNVWTADRFRHLRSVLRAAELEVDWYGNGSAASWLPGTAEEWEADGLRCLGFLPESDLVSALAAYPCVIVPSGSLDADDDNISFSRLSLPSRLVFLHGKTDTPVLLLGSPDTAAGRFLQRLGTGLCSAYDAADLRRQLDRLADPTEHGKIRAAIRRWAPHFVLPDGGRWLWDSLERRAPGPAGFAAAFPPDQSGMAWLETISRARPRFEPKVPQPGEPLTEDGMKAFAFLRTPQVALVQQEETYPLKPAEFEVTQLLERLVGWLLRQLQPGGGRVLVLGPWPPAWLTALPARFSVWRVADFERWKQSGYSGEPLLLEETPGALGTSPEESPLFTAIVGANWMDQESDPGRLALLAQFLTARTAPGGINLHATAAALHPEYFWTAPAVAFLRRHWGLEDWPFLDEMLSAGDLFVMSADAYEKHWLVNFHKTYEEFGKPTGVLVYWKKNPA